MLTSWSGRRDLNSGPHGPEPCALAGLSHAPNEEDYNRAIYHWQAYKGTIGCEGFR